MRKHRLFATSALAVAAGLFFLLNDGCGKSQTSHPGGSTPVTSPTPTPTPTDTSTAPGVPGGSPPPGNTPGGPAPTPTPSSLPALTIEITSKAFAPNPANVTKGQQVLWHNSDTANAHSATRAGLGGFDTGAIPPGGKSRAFKMTSTGSLDYHCGLDSLHSGTLVVK